MFEVKKIGNQWLIRPTGGQFRQLKIPAGALHVEVSDNFLLVDDIVYEIKASGNVAYAEKLQTIAIAEEAEERNTSAIYSKGGATSEETIASGNFAYVEKLQGISIAEKSDESACCSKTNITVAECENGADNNLSLEIEDGQTEYDSLEAGQTEETNVIETIKGDAKECENGADNNLSLEMEDGQTEYDSLEAGQTEEANVIETMKGDAKENYNSFHEILPHTRSACDGTHHGNTDKIFSQYPANTTLKVQEGYPGRVTDVSHKQTNTGLLREVNTQNCETYRTKENILVKVYCSDLLLAPVDCIVNEVNTNLTNADEKARAIEAAAGNEMTKEAHEFLKRHGQAVGQAFFTSAGNLNFKIIIHAVGPCWSDYRPYKPKEVDRCKHDLWNAVLNSLCLAERSGCKSIAFPAISSGIYGCPVDLCCIQYAKAIVDYSSHTRHPNREIHIVDINQEMVSYIQKTCKCMIAQGNPEYVCRLQVFPQFIVTSSLKKKVKKTSERK